MESGAENVLVCVEASAVLKAEFYISIVSVPTVMEFYRTNPICFISSFALEQVHLLLYCTKTPLS